MSPGVHGGRGVPDCPRGTVDRGTTLRTFGKYITFARRHEVDEVDGWLPPLARLSQKQELA